MTADMTTIKVPKNVRDRLIAIADERGRGTTLAAVLTDLLDKHETDKTRDRLAYLEVVAAAEGDVDAMARAQHRADQALDLLRARESR
ncbi:hypothetical protein HCN51_11670 [Nonomuraea sp. FMUSA5-5]|uniref:CopG family transcriptional regulator n=1 Tax=Nonomuraea composti TaxID=2720023 RepID=A0ABX1AWW5_9ACTN|nr:hypothetical protein [Nonomuraea sp. FMUSA5-5]NJP90099.1 hypothetical protein [Nonomuraea sp. FMUSA5-5]